MDNLRGNRQVQAQCRDLIRQYEPLFEVLIRNEEANLRSGEIEGDTSFKIAKESIRREGNIEGMKRLMQLVHRYAKES